MLSFHEALKILLENTAAAGVERCALDAATGRVLRENVLADREFPPFDRVMMDGYALRSSDWQAGQRTFRVTGSSPAGLAAVPLAREMGTCVEVMTGAPCPPGADCIVPVEEVRGHTSETVVFSSAAAPVAGRYIHRAGSDASAGQILLRAGTLLGSCQIGVAASCGAGILSVSKLPKIALVATGDELVAIDQTPEIHQIRQSNAHSLAAALGRAGFAPRHVGVLNDDATAARPVMESLLVRHDWMILTGAVSKGARDFVPALLKDLGCKKLFHGVAHRPGKPAGCWIGPKGQMILALPGNPVSALTGLHTLVLPALIQASGAASPHIRRIEIHASSLQLPEFTRHLPVALLPDGRAEPAATGNSGDFIGLLKSDGFVTLPPSGEITSIHSTFPFTPWL
jgi:molybdopterin molybdotransferase